MIYIPYPKVQYKKSINIFDIMHNRIKLYMVHKMEGNVMKATRNNNTAHKSSVIISSIKHYVDNVAQNTRLHRVVSHVLCAYIDHLYKWHIQGILREFRTQRPKHNTKGNNAQ
jgi:hypothetical protein